MINIIVCIAALVLFVKGIFILLKTKIIWMIYSDMMKSDNVRVPGRVVDIEAKGCNSKDTTVINDPIVEYKLGEEEEVTRRPIAYSFSLEVNKTLRIFYSPKTPHVGDKVTVIRRSDNSDVLLAFPSMPFTRLLCKLFVPGCIYVAAAVLGVCYVFI